MELKAGVRLRSAVDGCGLPAADRPLAVFDALAERFARDDFRGCAFINTMIEAAERDSAAHRVSRVMSAASTRASHSLAARGGKALLIMSLAGCVLRRFSSCCSRAAAVRFGSQLMQMGKW